MWLIFLDLSTGATACMLIKLFLFFWFSFSVRSFLPLLWPCWGVGSAEGPQGRVGIGHRWNPRTNSLEGKPLESENWKLYWTGHWQWKKNNFYPFILFGNNNNLFLEMCLLRSVCKACHKRHNDQHCYLLLMISFGPKYKLQWSKF